MIFHETGELIRAENLYGNFDVFSADMGGAATTMSAVWAISTLKIPVNIVLCIPLTENMPSGRATKPGDIVM